jgi:hypothetical protein
MMLHRIHAGCENGASHRKHVDTPPLRGSCQGHLVGLEDTRTKPKIYRQRVFLRTLGDTQGHHD